MHITVSPYNPQWPQDFENIKAELTGTLQDVEYVSIEHVGSTSVPGLPAKPIIDISIVVTRPNLPSAVEALTENAGYSYMGEWGITDRHVFRKPVQPTRNLYVCIEGSPALRNHLVVRDICREDPRVRERYGRAKMELSGRDWKDVDEYCDAKDEIVAWVLEQGGLSEAERMDIKHTNVAVDGHHHSDRDAAITLTPSELDRR